MSANSATRGTRVRASRTRPQKERISPGRCYGAETSPTVHARRKKWRANIYRRQLTKAGVRDNRKRCTRGSMRGPLWTPAWILSRSLDIFEPTQSSRAAPQGGPSDKSGTCPTRRIQVPTRRGETSTTKIQRINDDNRRQHLQTRLNRRDRVGRHGPGH